MGLPPTDRKAATSKTKQRLRKSLLQAKQTRQFVPASLCKEFWLDCAAREGAKLVARKRWRGKGGLGEVSGTVLVNRIEQEAIMSWHSITARFHQQFNIASIGLLVVIASFGSQQASDAKPPFHGTIFIEKNIVTETDPTAFTQLNFTEVAQRRMFDRRTNCFARVEAWLFEAKFDDSPAIEVQVNREFSREEAETEARFYLPAIGRIPQVLRSEVKTVWIHKGDQPFGGGNNNLLIHVGQGKKYARDGILEETFIHEASHTSLDDVHARAEGWQQAQAADKQFISTYAKDNPQREDVAESFLLYFAWRHRSDRISKDLYQVIESTIPNRLAYFDTLNLNLSPCVPPVN